ncbi:MAG: CoB--CoM heterodisulfide reductase subunit B [Euryarchaeota archaeon]|nr:CoB--CoM heterodisulfide reductase subunit B [Euryarchaeota archaeon]
MKRYALFTGCTVPAQMQNYEVSALKVAGKLGIELVYPEGFTCCGFPYEAKDTFKQKTISIRNLAVAEEAGLEVVTLCSTCGSTLSKANHLFRTDRKYRGKLGDALGEIGMEYRGTTRIRHFTRMLYEDVGVERIRSLVVRPFKGVKLAADYGCHYVKPAAVFDGFDDYRRPHTLDDLIEATGASSVDFKDKMACCGAALLAVDEKTSVNMTKYKLDNIRASGAEGMVTQCPFCGIMYDVYQNTIGEYNLPVLYLPQLLGVAFGIDPKELGFKINQVKATNLLKKVGA